MNGRKTWRATQEIGAISLNKLVKRNKEEKFPVSDVYHWYCRKRGIFEHYSNTSTNIYYSDLLTTTKSRCSFYTKAKRTTSDEPLFWWMIFQLTDGGKVNRIPLKQNTYKSSFKIFFRLERTRRQMKITKQYAVYVSN